MPRDAYLQHRILSADPVELVQILYEYALRFLQDARASLASGDIAGRSRAIFRVLGILGELEGSLNHEAGGSLSQNLAALYQYMRTQLSLTNMKRDDRPLAEVESLLKTLASAWDAIGVPEGQRVDPMPAPLIGGCGPWDGTPESAPLYPDHGWTL